MSQMTAHLNQSGILPCFSSEVVEIRLQKVTCLLLVLEVRLFDMKGRMWGKKEPQ